MPNDEMTLSSLLRQALSIVASDEAPPSDLVARIVDKISAASREEIAESLHVLWPYTRHIVRDEWLFALSRQLDSMPSAPPLRRAARESLARLELTPEQIEEGKRAVNELMKHAPSMREDMRRIEERSALAAGLAASLDADSLSDHVDKESGQPLMANDDGFAGRTDPLDAYLPPNSAHRDDAFWYFGADSFSFEETLIPACSFLVAVVLELRRKGYDDSLFWGVMGRVYEPFASGHSDKIEAKISAAESSTLDARISSGKADLLDYWHYLEDYRELGDDLLEENYTGFLAAVGQASAPECEALFPAYERLDFGNHKRPPRPEEERLPIADKLWETILAKPEISLKLLARAGLFYWLCRDPAQAPPRALAALGRLCEGDYYTIWNILPCLPFWVAAHGATVANDWDFAAVCLKRALLDIAIFSYRLEDTKGNQVHAFPFDPRVVRDIYSSFADDPLEQQLLGLALKQAIQMLRESPLDEWSQLHFVLFELSRRLGVKVVDEESLRALLGATLWDRLGEETKRLLAEAEATWVLAEQELHTTSDLAQIGLAYRRAIENEWRLRLAPILATIDNSINPQRPSLGNPQRATLGAMLRVLAQLNSLPQREKPEERRQQREELKQRLASVVGRKSRLFDQLFVSRARMLVSRYLNESAHVRLDREQCRLLRSSLWDGRLLHDLLVSVQPPPRPSPSLSGPE